MRVKTPGGLLEQCNRVSVTKCALVVHMPPRVLVCAEY
jgi:hypothetical protein